VKPETATAILDIAGNAFVTLDADGRVLEWNRRAAELFGYSREEALGRELAELIVPERYRGRHRDGLRQAGAASESDSVTARLIVEAVRRDGRELPVEVSTTVVRDGGEPTFHAWIQDVSERTELLRELEAQLRGRDPGFGQILDALAEAVTIRDPHHHILYANRAAFESMGFSSLEEMQRRPPHAIFAEYIVQDEHGDELTMDSIPSVRLLAGEQATSLLMRTINRSTGELRWQLLKSAPLHGEDGRPVAAVTVIEDVTRERTAELHDQFLARASEILMSSLDYEETLRNVAWLAVPEIADWCAVELVDDRGSRQRVAVAHHDPAKLELAEEVRRFEPDELHPDRGVGRILRTGESELYREIPDNVLARAAVNDEHLTLLRSIGFRSVLLVPLRARGRTFGVMTLVTAESMRRFDEADKEFAEQVAGWRPLAARLPTPSSGACCRTSSPGSTDGTWPRSTAPPALTRRSRSGATSTTSTRATTVGSSCSATSPARAWRRPRSPRWCATAHASSRSTNGARARSSWASTRP
jgi:PAS domain S-box-containing protein